MRASRFLIYTSFVLLGACSPKIGGDSSVSLRIPSLSELNSKPGSEKVGAADLTWSKACFMVNVTGSDIPLKSVGTCAVGTGAFAGSAPAGAALMVLVPKGSGRRIEVLAYFRRSVAEVCPDKKSGINDFELGRTASLGYTVASLQNDNEAVDVNISLPTSSQTVVSQFNLPPTCDTTPNAGGASSFTQTSGSAINKTSTNSGYKMSARLSPPDKTNLVSGGGYKLLRRGQ